MSFYTVTATARLAQASPSVSLEKGAYRLRAPPIQTTRTRRDASTSHVGSVTHSKRMAVLVVFLVLATMASFGSAYYLFTTRWAVRGPSIAYQHISDDASPPSASLVAGPENELQVVQSDARLEVVFHSGNNGLRHVHLLGHWGMLGSALAKIHHTEEKFLAYLPHSGFHNQRIAFENALVLSRLLNRTLLVPPIRLGNRPLTYEPFHELSASLANSTKDGLQHCTTYSQSVYEDVEDLHEECADYFEYTHVPWEWLIDLDTIKTEQALIQRWNFTDAWLKHELHIHAEDVFALHDVDRNHYGFQDFVAFSNTLARKYAQTIQISVLAERPERLLQVGTLFGSSRLHLRNHSHHSVRAAVRRSMAFTNAHLVRAAEAIRVALGGAYLAAHVRIADGSFEARAEDNVRLIWWKLLTTVLGFETEDALELEYELLQDMLEEQEQEFDSRGLEDSEWDSPPQINVDKPALRAPHPDPPPLPQAPRASLACRRRPHAQPHLQQFNIPLFIATDSPFPHTNPLLLRLTRTFPCTYFLSDFPDETRTLVDLVNERDDVPLGQFLMPFLDAMVAGRAWGVVGTERSTFSAFVTDVLWRTYHGWDIVQRG